MAACSPQTADAPVPEPLELPGVKGALLYMPEQFTYFAPKNAHDMLRHVPDFIIRGNGQGQGNVLIDGEYVPGDEGNVRARLAEIPAGEVLRIEIIDASSHGIPGAGGLLANLVLKEDDYARDHLS